MSHLHAPLRQVPLGHDLPHRPQFAASLARLTHALPHGVSPLGQKSHVPDRQAAPERQTLPHVPQLAGSSRDTQVFPQAIWPVAQKTQTLPLQMAPAGQPPLHPVPFFFFPFFFFFAFALKPRIAAELPRSRPTAPRRVPRRVTARVR